MHSYGPGRRRKRRLYDDTPSVGTVDLANYNAVNIDVSQTYQTPTVTVSSIPWPTADSESFQVRDLTGTYSVTYESSNGAVATISGSGLVTGIGSGTCTVNALCQGVRSPTISVTVTNPQNSVDHLVVTPATLALSISGTGQIAARPEDASNNLVTGRTVTHASSDTGIATVGADSGDDNHTATVTGVTGGTATITSTCDTKTDTCLVTVSSVSPYFSTNFDSGLGSGNGWSWGSSNNTALTSEWKRGGSGQSLRFTYTGVASCSDCTAEHRYTMGSQYTEMYTRMYLYIPDGTEGIGSAAYTHRDQSGCPSGQKPENNKLMRYWDEDYASYHVKGGFSFNESGTNSTIIPEYGRATDLSPYANSGVGSFGLSGSGVVIDSSVKGTWVKLVFHVKLATAVGANNGALRCWVNDVLKINHTTVPWFCGEAGANNYLRKGYVLGWANSGFTNTTKLYVDDIAWGPSYESVA